MLLEQGPIKRFITKFFITKNINTANSVGSRHGNCFVIKIDAIRMHNDGYEFFISENGVYLTKFVPKKYFLNILQSLS